MRTLGVLIVQAWHGATDPLRGGRVAWLLSTATLGAMFLALSAVYLVGGTPVIKATRSFVVILAIPGGLATHGVILGLLGIGLLHAVFVDMRGGHRQRRVVERLSHRVAGSYLIWTGGAFALAPLEGGTLSLTGAIIWPTIGLLHWILGNFLPVTEAYLANRRERLITACLDMGFTAQQALDLSDRYYMNTRLGGRA